MNSQTSTRNGGDSSTGMQTDFVVRIENVSNAHTLHTFKGDKNVGLSPGAWVLHTGANPMYMAGSPASTGMQRLAEDGNPEGLFSDLQFNPDVKATGAFNYTDTPYPVTGFIGPEQSYEFVVPKASPGDRLSFATMFIESNDWFYANNEKGIELFDAAGNPMSSDVTHQIGLWDAGTEVNEEPGVGMNQAPRQNRPDTGAEENAPVYAIVPPAEGFDTSKGGGITESGSQQWKVPDIQSVIKVTITPRTP